MPRRPTVVVVDELDEMFSTPALAEQLHVSVRTLEGWRLRGLGPRYVKAGPKRVLYRKSAIERWLQQQSKSHTRA